jgi:5-methylcytosine-specific restriction endonuclease McrA
MVAKDKRDHGKRKPVCGYRCRAFLQWGKWPDGQIPPSRRTMAETRLAYRPERSRQRWYAGACRGCGKQFISATIQDRWCSVECGARQAHEKRRARLRDAFVEPVNRMAIFERDRWRCQLCHRKVDKRLKHPHLMSATLDHIVPLAKGGKHEAVNVQLAHLHCNVAKRDNAANDQLLLFG